MHHSLSCLACLCVLQLEVNSSSQPRPKSALRTASVVLIPVTLASPRQSSVDREALLACQCCCTARSWKKNMLCCIHAARAAHTARLGWYSALTLTLAAMWPAGHPCPESRKLFMTDLAVLPAISSVVCMIQADRSRFIPARCSRWLLVLNAD